MQRSREGAAVVAVLLLLLVLAPLLYVAAVGPLVWLNGTGRINIAPDGAIARIYWPLETAVNNCEPLDSALQMYIRLWEPTPGVEVPPPGVQYVVPAPAPMAAPAPSGTPAASIAPSLKSP
jgi:hypothetical protein